MAGGIGFTATRKGLTKSQRILLRVQLVLQLVGAPAFDHGDCIGGDEDAHKIVCAMKKKKAFGGLGVMIRIHPPNKDKFRAFCKGDWVAVPKPYLARNKDIVNNTNAMIACPGELEEQERSGTWSTIRYARKQGKNVTVIFPNGTMRIETPMFTATYQPPIQIRKLT